MPNPDGSGTRVEVDATQTTALTAPAGMKFNDVTALVLADGTAHNVAGVTVDDADGDASLAGSGTAMGTMTAMWKNGGTPIAAGDLTQALMACGGPYTLTISAANVEAKTMYGAPANNLYGSHAGKTYTFVPSGQSICYIQPKDMFIRTGTAGVNIKYANGYNPSKWEYDSATSTHKGFKADAGFPTTGFVGAEFTLLGSGSNQSVFRCSSTNNTDITLSGGNNCTVTYNAKPMSNIVINMDYSPDGGTTWTRIDSYTIQAPSKWAIGGLKKRYGNTNNLQTSTSFPALDYCRTLIDGNAIPATTRQQGVGQSPADRAFRQQYLYRRNELSNSPLADVPEGIPPTYVFSNSSRDVDGTFTGEWGYVYNYTAAGSPWFSNHPYWTAEAWSTDLPFIVSPNGAVGRNLPHNAFGAVCRGE